MGFTVKHFRQFHSPAAKNHLLCRPNMHDIRPKTRKRSRRHQRTKHQYIPQSDDDPADIELLKRIFLSAEFTSFSKLGLFSLNTSVRCRSPPLVLHFQIQKKSEMEDKVMGEQDHIYVLIVKKKRIAVSKEVYKAYYKLKEREKYLDRLAEEKNISLEACTEKGVQVEYLITRSQESMEDKLIRTEMITKMMKCLNLLTADEKALIKELFFNGKSERQLSAETGIPQRTINDRKRKILLKLKKVIEK